MPKRPREESGDVRLRLTEILGDDLCLPVVFDGSSVEITLRQHASLGVSTMVELLAVDGVMDGVFLPCVDAVKIRLVANNHDERYKRVKVSARQLMEPIKRLAEETIPKADGMPENVFFLIKAARAKYFADKISSLGHRIKFVCKELIMQAVVDYHHENEQYIKSVTCWPGVKLCVDAV